MALLRYERWYAMFGVLPSVRKAIDGPQADKKRHSSRRSRYLAGRCGSPGGARAARPSIFD